ncbi:hypothetical protein VTK56DRAFT_5315 [Thermocarpiscus australiensis]
MASSKVKFELPSISPLKGEIKYQEWREAIDTHSAWFEANEHREKRLVAWTILRHSLSKEVKEMLQGYGWTNDNKDPKALNDAIIRYVPKISEEGWHNLCQEFMHLKSEDFESLRALLSRFNHLVSRLATVGVNFDTKVKQSIILGAIKDYDLGWYHNYPPKTPYHELCGRHHRGGDDRCWVAHPELKDQYYERRKATTANNNTDNQPPFATAAIANRAIFNYKSGVLNGINNN